MVRDDLLHRGSLASKEAGIAGGVILEFAAWPRYPSLNG